MYTQYIPHRKQRDSLRNTNLLVLNKEIIAVCLQVANEHINTLILDNNTSYTFGGRSRTYLHTKLHIPTHNQRILNIMN
jgi:hypothetical protein